jgi:hypothetical protein
VNQSRTCKSCNEEKPLCSGFHPFDAFCKPCRKEAGPIQRIPAKVEKPRLSNHRQRKFGLRPEIPMPGRKKGTRRVHYDNGALV